MRPLTDSRRATKKEHTLADAGEKVSRQARRAEEKARPLGRATAQRMAPTQPFGWVPEAASRLPEGARTGGTG